MIYDKERKREKEKKRKRRKRERGISFLPLSLVSFSQRGGTRVVELAALR